jgi:hypothetical protein
MSDQQTTMTMVACPGCAGRGNVPAFVDGERDGVEYGHFDHRSRCFRCNGRGEVTAQTAEWIARGRVVMDRRRAAGESVSSAALRLGFSAVDVSGMEHGRKDPAPLERAWQ